MRKSDLDLIRTLKKEEAKVKDQNFMQEQEKIKENGAISFDVWWVDINRQLKLLAHMKEIIRADFKGRGLTLCEPKNVYNEALKLFGYSI